MVETSRLMQLLETDDASPRAKPPPSPVVGRSDPTTGEPLLEPEPLPPDDPPPSSPPEPATNPVLPDPEHPPDADAKAPAARTIVASASPRRRAIRLLLPRHGVYSADHEPQPP